ncbi:MAG: GldG family protein [Candidatus Binataceae bacterium]
MARSSVLAGFLGLILLIFAAIDYFAAPWAHFFFLINLIIGVFAIIIWAASSGKSMSSFTGRRARYGANAAVYSIAFIALLVAINYISTIHHRRFDMTSEGIYSLSTQSQKVLHSLHEPVKFYGFFPGGNSAKAQDLYQMYSYASPQVTYEMVDPNKHPELAEKYKVTVMNTTHIQYGGDNGGGTNVTGLTEGDLTNGIIRVARSAKKNAYFLQGEGEPDIDDAQSATGFGNLRKAMEGEGYDVHKLLLATVAGVPANCSLLVVGGPTRPLLPHELDAINAFLKRGGNALVMLRPPNIHDPGAESGLVKLVGDWGVNAGHDIVVDQMLRLFSGPALGLNPLVDLYQPHHVITNTFNQRTVFPMTRSVEPETHPKAGLAVLWLAKTSPTSWAETNLNDLFEHQHATLDAKDQKGPITVADVVMGDLKTLGYGNGSTRMVVMGDTEFADNQYLDNFFNRDFLMNSADWLTGQGSEISIRPRQLGPSTLALTVSEFSIVFVLSVLLLPELLIILGIAVWWERRV